MDFEQLKENVKGSSDIVEVINSYVPLKRTGANYKALCPFHTEKTPSFTVNPLKQIFYCFGCQKGGDVIHFVMAHEGIDFMGALRILAPRVGVQFPETIEPKSLASKDSVSGEIRKDLLYEIHEKLTVWYQRNLQKTADQVPLTYLKGRGINDETINKFQLGYAPDSWRDTLNWSSSRRYPPELVKKAGIITVKNENDPISKAYDRFRDRLMFPIWDEQGRVIAFSGRVISEKTSGAKYVNSPETPVFRKSRILYGLFLARDEIRQQKCVLLCEGQMDVIACHQAGFNNTVASLGTSFTESQALLLKRYTDTIIMIFDSDPAGIKATLKSAKAILAANLAPKVVLLDEGEDPDSIIQKLGVETLKNRIEQAQDYFIFRLNLESKRNDITTAGGKESVVTSILQDVSLLNSPVMRAEYCRMTADRLNISESVVLQELKRVVKNSKKSRANEKGGDHRHRSIAGFVDTDNPASKTEATLLDIVIHHNAYALKLIEDLPPEFISSSAPGQALNTALGHIEQGEWDEIESVLIKRLNDYQSKDVNKVLFDSDFGPDTDEKTLNKAYAECLYRGIILRRIDEKRDRLERQLKCCPSKEKIEELQRKCLALRKQKSELHKKLNEGLLDASAVACTFKILSDSDKQDQ